MRLLHFGLFGLLLASSPALAEVGTVTLTVTASDFRINPYATAANNAAVLSPAGARQVNRFRNPTSGAASLIPLRRAWVAMTVTRNGTSSQYCGRTNDNGQVTLSWNSTLPATATLTVRPDAVNNSVTGCSGNTADFTIKTGTPVANEVAIVLHSASFGLTAGAVNRATTVGSVLGSLFQEAVSAYLTSLETLEMHDVNGAPFAGSGQSIRSSVAGFTVFVNDPNGLNVAPTFDRIITSTNRTTLRPTTMAHEIGHLVAWNNLGLTLPVINPLNDYPCYGNPTPTNSWGRTSEECTKVVFHEGFADMHAGLWMWHRTAAGLPVLAISFPGTNPNLGSGADVALEDNTAAGTDVGCGDFAANARFRHTVCVTAAMWDLVDTGSDSVVNADLSDIVGAFRSYRDDWLCVWPTDNRCKNEGTGPYDPDGNNWRDFKSAAAASPNLTQADLDLLETGASLGGTPDD